MTAAIEEHAGYLADRSRLRAYGKALARVVRDGDVVVDLGSGTGILGLLACQAGASRVYCVDGSRLLDVARTICLKSPFADRFSFVKGYSTDVKLPERVDVVVADQMDSFGVGAGIVECFADARQRFLKPDGALIPGRLTLWVAGVRVPGFRKQLSRVEAAVPGLDLTHVAQMMRKDPRWIAIKKKQLLTDAAPYTSLELGTEATEQLNSAVELPVTQDGRLHGIAGWFSAELAPAVELTNAPNSKQRIDRACIFLPFAEPVAAKPGDRLRLTLSVRTRRLFFAWHVEHASEAGEFATVCKQTSMSSLLLSQHHLAQRAPDFVPELDEAGLAQRTVLELCNAQRPLSQIVESFSARHPEKAPTSERATEFVLDVLGGIVR